LRSATSNGGLDDFERGIASSLANPVGDLAENGVRLYHEQDSRAGAAERYAEDARLAS
jgi:hypothetical protein